MKTHTKEYILAHLWVKENFGTPINCEICGAKNKLTNSKSSWIQWASIDHSHKMERSNWMTLCPICHHHFDSINNGKIKDK